MTLTKAAGLAATSAVALPLLLALGASPAQAALSAPTFANGRLTASSVTADVRFPGTDGIDRIRWTRTAPGQPTVQVESRERTRLTATGLQKGVTYTFAVRTVDIDGVESPAGVFRATPTAPPVLSVSDPITLSTDTPAFPVQVADPGNAPSTRYNVSYVKLQPLDRGAPRDVFAIDTSATSLVFGGDNTAEGVRETEALPGRSYYFYGLAKDVFGNLTDLNTSPRTSVPIDQGRAAVSGAVTTVTRTGSFGGTVAKLGDGGIVSLGLRGDRVQVIGERCPTCGAVDIILNGRVVTQVDTYAPTRQVGQVLFSRSWITERNVAVAVRGAVTAARPDAFVDALAPLQGVDVRERGGLGLNAYFQGSCCPLFSWPRTDTSSQLTMQDDGNLVVRDGAGDVAFSSRTNTNLYAYLRVQADGNAVIYSRQGRRLWSTGTAAVGGAYLVMQRDANLVLLARTNGKVLWSSKGGRA